MEAVVLPGRNQRLTYAGWFSIPQIVNNTSPSSREISRLGLALPCEYSRIARGVSEPVYEGTAPWIYYSMGANVIWRRSGRVSRASRLSRAQIREPRLVIQLARYCPMILDRPPIHRFNAVKHVPRTLAPAIPPHRWSCDGIRWQMTRGTIDLFQPNRFDSTARNVIDPEEVDMGLCLREIKSFAPLTELSYQFLYTFCSIQNLHNKKCTLFFSHFYF